MASTGKLDQTLRKISNASPPHPLAALHAVDDTQAKSNRGVCVCGEGGGARICRIANEAKGTWRPCTSATKSYFSLANLSQIAPL